jgi:hypothetical protein
MIDNYERLVGRLMDLETKFYELQEKYQTLINDYEKLKDIHDAERSGCWVSLSTKEREEIHEMWTYTDSLSDEQSVIDLVDKLLKDKNEKNCSRHRDELGTRYDPFTSHTGR